jgi:hypothetical protein
VRRIAIGLLVGGVFGVAAWQAALALQNETAETAAVTAPQAATPEAPVSEEPSGSSPKRSAPAVPAVRSATPMAQRVAVLGLLNKRNGISRDIRLHPGQSVRVGDVILRLRACETTAPWEPQKLTGAFVQTDVRERDNKWRRVFSGWLYKESPSFNVVEHRIYDVWPKSCEMQHPDIGPETVPASSAGVSSRRSSAKKSGEDAVTAPPETPSASSSNET